MSTETRYEDSTSKQRRRERREKRQEEFRRRQESERRRKILLRVGFGVVAVLVVVLLGTLLVLIPATRPTTGQRVLELSRDHVARGAPHPPYNSVPATSGPHWSDQGAPVPFGVYDEPVAEEAAVHNLEHGDVV